ncbi:energy transducer TonB [Flavicella sp.]|uniref:energy transducer TonB n=1 Tax=Flavicella sp. TaxID=2957742 RepID=UPI00301B2756
MALFFIYIGIEHKTSTKEITNFSTIDLSSDRMEEMIITHRKPPPIKQAPPPPPKLIEAIKIVEDISDIIETIIESTETDESEAVITSIDIDLINEAVEYEEIIEDIPFAIIEDVPIYPGCEKGNKEDKKACFSDKIRQHINNEFDSNIANKLGLSEGKKKIYVMFTINEHGNITEVKARAPHPRLQAEAKRVILSLPKMTPGKQRKVPVRVRYSLPITFEVII